MSNRTDIVVETDNAEGQVLLSASRVYDLTEDKTQDTINSEVGSSLTSLGNTLTQLDGAKAAKADLASPTNKTKPNNDSNPIAKGTYFYLDGDLARAKQFIDANAPFTSGTNYELVTAGGLNSIGTYTQTTLATGINKYVNYTTKHIFVVFQNATIPAAGVATGENLVSDFFLGSAISNGVFSYVRANGNDIVWINGGEERTGVYGTWYGLIA